MKVLIPGHKYLLENMEQDPAVDFSQPAGQIIQFIQKEKKDDKLVTINNGTTNEEVLRMMADRLVHLNTLMPNHWNEMAVEAIGVALTCMEARTKERETRGVEGTPRP